MSYLMKLIFSRRERLALVLLGILMVSFAAGLAAATARSTQGAMDKELAKHWRTDYDLLIRHPSAVSSLEGKLEAIPGNYQANMSLTRGISHAQLAEIRDIPGVEVAAPLTFVGYANAGFEMPIKTPFTDAEALEPGIYKVQKRFSRGTGLSVVEEVTDFYFYIAKDDAFTLPTGAPINYVEPSTYWNSRLSNNYYGFVSLIVGVQDTWQSMRDDAVLDWLQDQPSVSVWDYSEEIDYTAANVEFTRDDGDAQVIFTLQEQVSPALVYRGGETGLYLEAVDSFTNVGDSRHWSPEGSKIISPDNEARFYAPPSLTQGEYGQDLFRLPGKALEYEKALAAIGYFDPDKLSGPPGDSPVSAPIEIFNPRLPRVLDRSDNQATSDILQPVHRLGYSPLQVGAIISLDDLRPLVPGEFFYDTVRVRVSGVEDMTEQSQLRIAAIAQQIRRDTGLHVDIVLGSSPQRTPVDLYSNNSLQRQEYQNLVSQEMDQLLPLIQEETGYPVAWKFATFPNTDSLWIMAPGDIDYLQRVELTGRVNELIQDNLAIAVRGKDVTESISGDNHINIWIPDYRILDGEDRDYLGQVEEYWIKLGTQLRIYQETNRGTFWITIGLLVVSTLFIGNTTYISTVGRTGEFSTLRSLGWRRSTVFWISLAEILLISITAGTVTAGVLGLIWIMGGQIESWLLLAVIPAVILTFMAGSLLPLIRTIFIQPLRGMKQGELRKVLAFGGSRPIGFVLQGLASRPGRTMVTITALFVPSLILTLIYSVSVGVQAVLGKTLLGEYMALELRGYHFVLNALIFVLAGLAVTDTLLINLRERKSEFGLLKAVGWRNQTVAGLIFWEGVGLGLIGGLLGSGLGFYAYWKIFISLPPNMRLSGALLALVPALVGGLAAILPAVLGAKVPVAQTVKAE